MCVCVCLYVGFFWVENDLLEESTPGKWLPLSSHCVSRAAAGQRIVQTSALLAQHHRGCIIISYYWPWGQVARCVNTLTKTAYNLQKNKSEQKLWNMMQEMCFPANVMLWHVISWSTSFMLFFSNGIIMIAADVVLLKVRKLCEYVPYNDTFSWGIYMILYYCMRSFI